MCRFAIVDAFTDEPFGGNPAAVCLLDSDRIAGDVDRRWMLLVAAEFRAPVTAFLAPAAAAAAAEPPRFHIRWFTTVTEVELCGHATLAAAHFLLTGDLAGAGVDAIEFVTTSGVILTARRLAKSTDHNEVYELDFPVATVVECGPGVAVAPAMTNTLNGGSVVNFCTTSTVGDVMVELSSGEEVARVHPDLAEIKKCARRGLIITGRAALGSQADFFTRLFTPNLGVNEDLVCASVHCALAPYCARKLGKTTLTSYMASSRGGMLRLELDEGAQRVRIHGAAVTIMVGTLLV